MTTGVYVFMTNIETHVIPNDVMKKAKALSQNCSHEDKRTKTYKYLEKWAAEMDEKVLKDWAAQ